MNLQLQKPTKDSKMTHEYLYFTIPNCIEGTRLIPYAATQVDMLTDDWCIVK